MMFKAVFGRGRRNRPPAGGAVARENAPPEHFLTRALRFLPSDQKNTRPVKTGRVFLAGAEGIEPATRGFGGDEKTRKIGLIRTF